MVALGVSNLCFMLPWQFAQFVLLTQVNPEHRPTHTFYSAVCRCTLKQTGLC